jgi:hypothetical protein
VGLTTNTRLLSGVTMSAVGYPTIGTVASTAFVAVLMAVTLLDPTFATYAVCPFGATVTASGIVPTGIVATTVFDPVSMTATLLALDCAA